MVPYLFAAAALLAGVGIMIVFKINLDKVKDNPENAEKAKNNFFIGTAIVETIPIVLIVFALINATDYSMQEVYVPISIIIATMVFSLFFIFLQRRVDVDEESRRTVNSFAIVALALSNSIPLVSLIMLLMYTA